MSENKWKKWQWNREEKSAEEKNEKKARHQMRLYLWEIEKPVYRPLSAEKGFSKYINEENRLSISSAANVMQSIAENNVASCGARRKLLKKKEAMKKRRKKEECGIEINLWVARNQRRNSLKENSQWKPLKWRESVSESAEKYLEEEKAKITKEKKRRKSASK